MLVMVDSAVKKQAYRPKQEIVYRILIAARAPKTRTKILYESMITWEECNEYLKELMKQGLLKYDPFNSAYMTTDKGMKFIGLYSRLKDELSHNM